MDRPPTPSNLVGTLLDGRYQVGALIARGGMATVYEGVDLRLDRRVALKVVPPSLSSDSAFGQRFVREARAAARLTHPNVVAVYDQGDDDGTLFLVMEYVDGRHTLRTLIRDEAPLSPLRALGLLEQILAAIAAAHEAGIIHRDLKPENVLLDPRGRVKVADFGLARAASSANAASTATATDGVLMGTVSYIAPELVTDGRADARSDVYSLGVMLFELLTGHKPHTGDNPVQIAYRHVHEDVPAPSSLVGGIPPYVDALVARATSRDSDLRPADAHVMLRQVNRVRLALEEGVDDDPELTSDLTPTIAVAMGSALAANGRLATGSPLSRLGPPGSSAGSPPGQAANGAAGSLAVPAGGSGSAAAGWPAGGARLADVDEVFDQEAYDDFGGREHTLVVPPQSISPGGGGRSGGGGTAGLDTYPTAAAPPGFVAPAMARSSAVSPSAAESRTAPPPGDPPRRQQRAGRRGGRRRLRGWIVFLLVLLLAGGAGYAGWYYGVGRFQRTPDVVSLTQRAALADLTQQGLTLEVTGSAYSEKVPVGHVISTDPTAGSRIRKGGTVRAIVSKGPERYDVPRLDGRALRPAAKLLRERHLDLGHVSRVWSATVPAGHVVSSQPKRGTALRGGTPVALVVSRGPRPIAIVNFVGQPAARATHQLTSAGFHVTKTWQYDDQVTKGDVISQQPNSGTGHRGDTIALVVSRGPQLVQVPDVSSQPHGIKWARETLKAAGFKVKVRQNQPSYGLGYVVAQSPAPGTMAPYGSTVTIYVI